VVDLLNQVKVPDPINIKKNPISIGFKMDALPRSAMAVPCSMQFGSGCA
jgi:hypothetical protein